MGDVESSDSSKPKGLKKAIRSFSRYWNTAVFDLSDATNRKALWASACKQRVFIDEVACLKAVWPPGLDLTGDVIQRHWEELSGYRPLRDTLERHRPLIDQRVVLPALSDPLDAVRLFCYVATRLLKPSVVVETGCATGWVSALFLLALHHNHHGHLYSIDLPPVAGTLSMNWTMPEGLQAGFLVPPQLRDRWTFIRGDVRVELIPLLEKLGHVDLFCHDSDHTYVHMMWEYTSVWPYLSTGGVLLSDDIGWNTALWDFATAVGRPIMVHRSNTNVGALSKS